MQADEEMLAQWEALLKLELDKEEILLLEQEMNDKGIELETLNREEPEKSKARENNNFKTQNQQLSEIGTSLALVTQPQEKIDPYRAEHESASTTWLKEQEVPRMFAREEVEAVRHFQDSVHVERDSNQPKEDHFLSQVHEAAAEIKMQESDQERKQFDRLEKLEKEQHEQERERQEMELERQEMEQRERQEREQRERQEMDRERQEREQHEMLEREQREWQEKELCEWKKHEERGIEEILTLVREQQSEIANIESSLKDAEHTDETAKQIKLNETEFMHQKQEDAEHRSSERVHIFAQQH